MTLKRKPRPDLMRAEVSELRCNIASLHSALQRTSNTRVQRMTERAIQRKERRLDDLLKLLLETDSATI